MYNILRTIRGDSMKIGNVEIKNRVVFAPMAGISNSAYRRIIKEKQTLSLKHSRNSTGAFYQIRIINSISLYYGKISENFFSLTKRKFPQR